MMADVRIAHLRRRYRMRAESGDERRRLDRVLQSAIDDELLDAALERAGIPTGEEVCIRQVDSVVRLDPAHPDARLAAKWCVALADAIAQRVNDRGPDVVRYRTRHLALVDLACAATRGDLARAWAWRSLGIWRGADVLDVDEARREVVAALAREPRLAPRVLSVLARRGLLPLLVLSVRVEGWIALARASLVAWGVGESIAKRLLVADVDVAAEEGEGMASERIVSRAWSTLAHAASGWCELQVDHGRAARSLAVLTLLEVEPALVASERGVAVVRQLAQRLAMRAAPTRVGPSTEKNVRVASGTRVDGFADESAEDGRARAATAWGGLLFLLHVIRALDLPATLLAVPALGARSLRWTLHQLAMLLVPVAEGDPAALAFAGLAPGSRPPAMDEPPLATESAVLHSAHAAIIASLRAIMRATDEESATALVQRIASRSAEIVAEPAWIEIRLSAAEVSTSVRRAGLDLDPDWIPWLGVVVRFVYV
jgi:hypothetical protein